jgi:hypothetical protein
MAEPDPFILDDSPEAQGAFLPGPLIEVDGEVRFADEVSEKRAAEVHRAFLGHCRATYRANLARAPIPGADDARAEAALMSRARPGRDS